MVFFMHHMKRTQQANNGFTLIEILLVIGIIGILASIIIIAINPTKQLQDARSTDRRISIREIENAISQYIIDGNTLSNVPAYKSIAKPICQHTFTGALCTGAPINGYDLSVLTTNSTYLNEIPIDPSSTGSTRTGYRLYKLGSFIKACSPVLEEDCGP